MVITAGVKRTEGRLLKKKEKLDLFKQAFKSKLFLRKVSCYAIDVDNKGKKVR